MDWETLAKVKVKGGQDMGSRGFVKH
jgi:hypothetical protein